MSKGDGRSSGGSDVEEAGGIAHRASQRTQNNEPVASRRVSVAHTDTASLGFQHDQRGEPSRLSDRSATVAAQPDRSHAGADGDSDTPRRAVGRPVRISRIASDSECLGRRPSQKHQLARVRCRKFGIRSRWSAVRDECAVGAELASVVGNDFFRQTMLCGPRSTSVRPVTTGPRPSPIDHGPWLIGRFGRFVPAAWRSESQALSTGSGCFDCDAQKAGPLELEQIFVIIP